MPTTEIVRSWRSAQIVIDRLEVAVHRQRSVCGNKKTNGDAEARIVHALRWADARSGVRRNPNTDEPGKEEIADHSVRQVSQINGSRNWRRSVGRSGSDP